MLSILVLVLVALVTIGTVALAAREGISLRREVDGFVAGIEQRTTEDEGGQPSAGSRQGDEHPVPPEIGQLLDEAIQTDSHGLAVLALNELTGRASLARARALSFARGFSRIGLLCGAAGAFAAAALGSFEKPAMIHAGGSVLMGLLCSTLSHSLTRRLRATAKRYGELTDILAKRVESQFRANQGEIVSDSSNV